MYELLFDGFRLRTWQNYLILAKIGIVLYLKYGNVYVFLCVLHTIPCVFHVLNDTLRCGDESTVNRLATRLSTHKNIIIDLKYLFFNVFYVLFNISFYIIDIHVIKQSLNMCAVCIYTVSCRNRPTLLTLNKKKRIIDPQKGICTFFLYF